MNPNAALSSLKGLIKKPLPLLLLLLGILFLVFGGVFAERGEADSGEGDATERYRVMLEAELADLLGQIRGVGKVEVAVTMASGERHIYSGSKLIESEPPRVLGVAVVCAGGARAEIRSEIASLLSSLLGIGSYRIHVSEKRA